jgi:multidrug efflux pump subunit AcrB
LNSTERNKTLRAKFPAFSIIIVFVMLMVVGAAFIPLLNIQLNPSNRLPGTSVNFYWHNASARVIEQEVTSKIEGVLNQMKGVKRITSVSRKGSGYVYLEFKKGTNTDALRFEMATLLRQLYPNLPMGVSYPQIVMRNTDQQNKGVVLTYTLNASASPIFIQKYAEKNIVGALSLIEGVNDVNVYGGTPFEWVITFDENKMNTLGINGSHLSTALNSYLSHRVLGVINEDLFQKSGSRPVSVNLQSARPDSLVWEEIPVAKSAGRIVYLGDVASIQYREKAPTSYHRINGLNTVNLVVSPADGVNALRLASKVKEEVIRIKQQLPPGYTMILAYDATEFIRDELQKIGLRTLFSMLILLFFVFIVSRKWRYLFLILVSIVCNLLLAVIFYYLFKIEMHLYSLAGITVSFGMLIDNSIIMVDHIKNRGNRKVFLAILAATLTTVGALSVVFFLKEQQRVNLADFALVIIINLSVSMLVALFFIPALFEKFPIKKRHTQRMIKGKRRVVKISRFYSKSIAFSKKWKWAYIVLFVLGFGIPVHLLPDKIEGEDFWPAAYNNTLGSDWFVQETKPLVAKILGGSFRLFGENVYEQSFYSEPQRTKLYARATMPEGCTVQQLNVAVKKMENMLSRHNEIESYQTSIRSPQDGSIVVEFKKDFEYTSFPYYLKEEMIQKATQLGGLDWSVYGVGRGFSNSLHSGAGKQEIIFGGYNYDQLYAYALKLKNNMEENPRVKDIEIKGSSAWRAESLHEYYLDFNPEMFAFYDTKLHQFYGVLSQKLYQTRLQSVFSAGEMQDVSLVSSNVESFGVWELNNTPLEVAGRDLKMSGLGRVQKRRTGNSIHKENQQYQLVLSYNFIGPYQLAKMVREEHVEQIRKELMMGYSVHEQNYSWQWDKKDKSQYYLLFLIVAIIFVTCSVLLESFKQPLAIIGMIPFSFIGVFLTFYLLDINFDQGGFASFVLLCGIVVNSGLYILNDYNQMIRNTRRSKLRCYINAFNHKIVPIILTILSTILGLIPFVWAGQNEVFWFSFAAGAMGGLVFSLIALFVYLPLFFDFREPRF